MRYLLFTSKYLQSDFQILSFYLPVSRRDFPVTAQGTFPENAAYIVTDPVIYFQMKNLFVLLAAGVLSSSIAPYNALATSNLRQDWQGKL